MTSALAAKTPTRSCAGEFTPKIGDIENSLIVGGSYEHTGGTLAPDFIFTDEENEGIPIN